MVQFQWLWAFAFFPLPFIIRFLLPSATTVQDAALRVSFVDDFQNETTTEISLAARRWLLILAGLAWICLVLAASRPQWLGDRVEIPISGRDLMMAVDLSSSMQMDDFEINGKRVDRLTATKYVASEFIKRREGDRLGLILFGRQAYLQTPLTFDLVTVETFLQESAIDLAGKETAIGDAIGLAIKRLQDKSQESRVLILLTDGANTAGEVQPIKAAELAAEVGLKIYTIGIGADEMLRRSFFGTRRVNPSADLDEEALTAIAQKTGGRYFRARNTKELEDIYTLLDKLEPLEQEAKSFRPVTALYYWPLGLAIVLAGLVSILRLNGVAR